MAEARIKFTKLNKVNKFSLMMLLMLHGLTDVSMFKRPCAILNLTSSSERPEDMLSLKAYAFIDITQSEELISFSEFGSMIESIHSLTSLMLTLL